MQKRILATTGMITPCEMRILDVLWEQNYEMTWLEIQEKVNSKYQCGWKKDAVVSFLKRLVKKGLVYRRSELGSRYYRAVMDKDECLERYNSDNIGRYVQKK